MKIIDLKDGLIRMEDPRRTDRGNIRHKLEDIITIGLCTLIGNGEDFEDMEDFGKEREEWFREFLELPNGIPCSDTFRRLFERLNPESLSECLYDWLANNRKEGSVIAIDGKTICGSSNHAHKAYHVVSAFIAENQITLGEITDQIVMIRDHKLYCCDTAAHICQQFKGKIYEVPAGTGLGNGVLLLSERQSENGTMVRLASDTPLENGITVSPTLEDAFLCIYRDVEQ